MEASATASKVKRVKMTPASADESKLKLRNYTPRDPELKKFILKKDNSEDSLIIKKQQLERFVTLSSGNSTQTLTLAPKKPNWDLKRDVARRLEKLEKRTQRAILELAQEKQKIAAAGGAESVD